MMNVFDDCSFKRICQFVAITVFLLASTNMAFELYQKPYDDLPSFYWAAKLALEQSLSPYQPVYFRELESSFHQRVYPFLYPPPSLLIFSPALLIDYAHAKIFISVLNLLLWWLMAWLMYRLYCFHTGAHESFLAAILISLGLCFFAPVIDTLRTGQINLFVLMCLAPLLFFSQTSSYRIACGFLLSLAILLKIYLLLIIPILLVFRQWRIIVGALSGLVLFSLLGLLLPHQLWLDWFFLGHNSAGYGKLIPHLMTIPWNQSLNGFFIRQAIEEKSSGASAPWIGYIYFSAGLTLGLMFYVVMRYLKKSRRGFPLAIALAMLVTTLVAPLTWLHHFVFALPAIICCFGLLTQQSLINKKIFGSILFVSVTVLSLPLIVNLLFGNWAGCCFAEAILWKKNLFQSVSLMAALTLFLVFCGLVYGAIKASDSEFQC